MNLLLRFVLFLLALAAVGCGGAPAELTEAEEAEIYATIIRQIYTEDDTFGGTLQPGRVYVIGTTDDSAGDPSMEESNSALIAESVRQEVTTRLSDLPTEIVWIESRDEVALDPDTGAVSDDGVIITLGNVDPQDETSVYVPSSIYVAGLAAGGQTYVVERMEGVWTVTGNTGAEWIS